VTDTTATAKVVHTCNPRQPGKPLPFGKRDPKGKCPRCAELDAGAEPRAWHGKPAANEDSLRAAEIAAHFRSAKHRNGGCGPVCTFGDW
jgi:hypothetical protein